MKLGVDGCLRKASSVNKVSSGSCAPAGCGPKMDSQTAGGWGTLSLGTALGTPGWLPTEGVYPCEELGVSMKLEA